MSILLPKTLREGIVATILFRWGVILGGTGIIAFSGSYLVLIFIMASQMLLVHISLKTSAQLRKEFIENEIKKGRM